MTPSDTGPNLPAVEEEAPPLATAHESEGMVALPGDEDETKPIIKDKTMDTDSKIMRQNALDSLRATREAARRNVKKTKMAFDVCQAQNDSDQFKQGTSKFRRKQTDS